MAHQPLTPGTTGVMLRSGIRYDMLAWLLTFGRERAFRERLVRLARLDPGESLLDVGCGTGTLAIAAKRRVGPAGAVSGIDASPEMVASAVRKAHRAGVDVDFTRGVAQALPFPDGRFDVVLSTLMLHHLPKPARARCADEMRRVLRPGGRVLAVDFGPTPGPRRGLLARFHRHGNVSAPDIMALLDDAGMQVIDSGEVGISTLHFALAVAPRS